MLKSANALVPHCYYVQASLWGKILFIVTISLLFTYNSFLQPIELVNAFPNLGFNQPIFLTHSNDGTNRIFVVQQNGIIYVFPNDSAVTPSRRDVFLNISDKLSSAGGEEGLLGLAFHPNYKANGYFYVNYTAPSPRRTVVARYSVTPVNPNKADPLSELKIMEISQPYSNHNGGMILFGADGYLYIGMGDGGSGGDPQNYAQNLQSLLGKILRIDIDTTVGAKNYGVPPTNPFYGNPLAGKEEIYAWGLRNPWRFSQDFVTGYIIAGDVGQNAWEEINLIELGKNYGWRCYEGNNPYNLSGCEPISTYTFPLKVYANPGLGCSVTGGYIYRGYKRPDLVGAYIYGDYCSGKIWKFVYQGGNITADSMILDAPFYISSFGVDQYNELYICNYSNGNIQRFVGSPLSDVDRNYSSISKIFSLEQNYPNPFSANGGSAHGGNTVTTIRFTIPYTTHVTLKVFDLLGREVAVLVNQQLEPGTYKKTLEAAQLTSELVSKNEYASGVYFYQMRATDFVQTRKLVLTK